MKINPDKPFGNFEIQVQFMTMNDDDYFKKIQLHFNVAKEPLKLLVEKSEEGDGTSKEVVITTTVEHSEEGSTQDTAVQG